MVRRNSEIFQVADGRCSARQRAHHLSMLWSGAELLHLFPQAPALPLAGVCTARNDAKAEDILKLSAKRGGCPHS